MDNFLSAFAASLDMVIQKSAPALNQEEGQEKKEQKIIIHKELGNDDLRMAYEQCFMTPDPVSRIRLMAESIRGSLSHGTKFPERTNPNYRVTHNNKV